jgi:hypothetical protein
MNECADQILSDLKFEHVSCIRLNEIEDSQLIKAKTNRTLQEYAWTLKPAVLYHVMNKFSDAQYFAHVDADIYFFSTPEKIFNENPEASLYLTEHNNSDRFRNTYELTGKYNTGFVGCKNDSIALSAVKWWKKKCIEWCYKEPNTKEKLFGDQRYVERWAQLFSKVHVVTNEGVNVAVWNVENYQLAIKDEKVYVDDEELIFYHFSGLNIYNAKEYNLTWFQGLPHRAVNLIYKPYMKALQKTIENIQKLYPECSKGFTRKGSIANIHYYQL